MKQRLKFYLYQKQLVILLVGLFCSSSLLADEGPKRGVMLNKETKGCASYFSGDECTKVELPQGWTPAPSSWDDSRAGFFIKQGDKETRWRPGQEERCCTELGYKFDPSAKLISKPSGKEKDPNSACYQISEPVMEEPTE